MNQESDGIDEAIEQLLRGAMMAAARTGEQLSRLREASARRAEAASMKEAAELEARLRAQQAEARTVYGQVRNPDWWDRAEHKDIVTAYETAHAWKDRDPQAEAAIQTTHTQVRERYGVDLPADPEAARAAMADADRFYAAADRQNQRGDGDRQSGTNLLRDADLEDRLADQAREAGDPAAAQDHENRAGDNQQSAGYAYDSAERRQADAKEWEKSGDAAAVEARRTADQANGRPARESTRPQRTSRPNTTRTVTPRSRQRTADVGR